MQAPKLTQHLKYLFAVFILLTSGNIYAVSCFKLVKNQISYGLTLPLKHSKAKENQLFSQGYKKSYTGGIDQIESYLKLAKNIRNKKIQPDKDHIDLFVDDVLSLLQLIENALEQQNKRAQLEPVQEVQEPSFEQLKIEALQRLKDKQVTYLWWNRFNFRASALLTTANLKKYSVNDSHNDLHEIKTANTNGNFDSADQLIEDSSSANFEQILKSFSEYILIPVIDESIGIIAMNRLLPTGISFVRVNQSIDQNVAKNIYPDQFFFDDLIQFKSSLTLEINSSNETATALYERFNQKAVTLPQNEREMFEFTFFLSAHKLTLLPHQHIVFKPNQVKEYPFFSKIELIRKLNTLNSEIDLIWLKKLIPNDVDQSDRSEVIKFFNKSKLVFDRNILPN